jgi:hypothetical protein
MVVGKQSTAAAAAAATSKASNSLSKKSGQGRRLVKGAGVSMGVDSGRSRRALVA